MRSACVATLSGGWHSVTHHLSDWASSIVDKGGAWPVLILIVTSAGFLGYAVMIFVTRPSRRLADVVEPYRLREEEQEVALPGTKGEVMTVPMLRRISQALTSFLGNQGREAAIQQQLVRSGLPLGVGEFALVSIIAGVILAVLGAVVGHLIGFLAGVVLAIALPPTLLKVLADERSKRFNAQLPSFLQVLASTLRAGLSLAQGLDSLVEDTKPPMNAELRRALAGARLGLPLEDALMEVSQRVSSPDFDWTVMAIRIQREVGGNLAEILDTVAHTMIERGRLRREIRTLTAEGRLSAVILGALPILIGLFIFTVNRSYIDQLFHSTPGEVALFGGVVLELFGAWWMYRTIQIDI